MRIGLLVPTALSCRMKNEFEWFQYPVSHSVTTDEDAPGHATVRSRRPDVEMVRDRPWLPTSSPVRVVSVSVPWPGEVADELNPGDSYWR